VRDSGSPGRSATGPWRKFLEAENTLGAPISGAFFGAGERFEIFVDIKVLSTGFAALIRVPPVVRRCEIC